MRKVAIFAVAGIALWQAACASSLNDDVDLLGEEEQLGDQSEGVGTWNGMDSYKILHASILLNKIWARPLLANPLGNLTSDVKDKACQDGTSLEALGYLAKCALPDGESISISCPGKPRATFSGELGLAPNWKTNACGEACRGWVSACMIAVSNFRNQDGIPVNLVASKFHYNSRFEEFRHEEGAYWGDVFNTRPNAQVRHGCRGGGADFEPSSSDTPLLGRVCGNYSATNRACTACDDPGSGPDSCPKVNYFTNLGADDTVRACSNACERHVDPSGAGGLDAYWTSCLVHDDSRKPQDFRTPYVITVRRK